MFPGRGPFTITANFDCLKVRTSDSIVNISLCLVTKLNKKGRWVELAPLKKTAPSAVTTYDKKKVSCLPYLFDYSVMSIFLDDRSCFP